MIALVNALPNGVQYNTLILNFGLIISNAQTKMWSKMEYDICRVHNAQIHKTISNRVVKHVRTKHLLNGCLERVC